MFLQTEGCKIKKLWRVYKRAKMLEAWDSTPHSMAITINKDNNNNKIYWEKKTNGGYKHYP